MTERYDLGNFGAWLKHVLKERQMTQRELAELTGIDEGGMSRYIYGIRRPRWKVVEKILNALDCHIEILPNEQKNNEYKVPIQSLIDHIKTACDVDPWAKEMAEELLKKQEESVPLEPLVMYLSHYVVPPEMYPGIHTTDEERKIWRKVLKEIK